MRSLLVRRSDSVCDGDYLVGSQRLVQNIPEAAIFFSPTTAGSAIEFKTCVAKLTPNQEVGSERILKVKQK